MTDVPACLKAGPGAADTLSMLNAEAEILSLDLDCFRLLQGYRETCLGKRADRAKAAAKLEEQQQQAETADGDQPRTAEPEPQPDDAPTPDAPAKAFDVEKGDPWVDRICELDGVEPEDLCKVHGKLIAAGFINFQIRNRTTGIEYRVANAGKQYLTRKLTQASELTAEAADADDDDARMDTGAADESADTALA